MAFVRYRHVSVAITLALGLHLGCGGEVEQAVLASAPGENSELPGDDNGSNDAGVGAEGDSPDETGDAGPIATDAAWTRAMRGERRTRASATAKTWS